MKRLNAFLIAASQRQDIVLVAIMMAAVFMMILPLPTVLVDMLIALNIMLSIMILTIAIYVRNPLDFLVFPSLLLITTLYRLALTITTSRLILLQADAGEIVYTFGNFVVGGNVAVGIIIFTIITIVQFIVITKGAERVAEVTARFTLDGMPGKQMSIDGDMRANAITVEEAKIMRELLQKESRLYGAMDGAMKFVKGDAIASMIVVLVNIVGGIAIGMLQRNMGVGEALTTYAVLSVGDGLIAQIPALLISITAGLIVTRIPGEATQNLAEQMVEEISRQPWVLLISGLVLTIFALIPGFPMLIFGGLALCAFIAGFYVLRRKRSKVEVDSGKVRTTKQALVSSLPCPLTVRIGPNTVDRAILNAALIEFCNKKFEELGLQISVPRIIDSLELPPNKVEIDLYVVPVVSLFLSEGRGFAWRSMQTIRNAIASVHDDMHVLPSPDPDLEDEFFADTQNRDVSLAGAQDIDWDDMQETRLQWGLQLSWLTPEQQAYLERLGVPVYTEEARVIELLDAVVERYAEDFIGVQEARVLLDAAEGAYPELARELLRSVAVPKISEILQRLVMEKVSIRDLRLVFEALIDWSSKEKEVVLLTEYIRISLRRQICHRFSGSERHIDAILIGERIEGMIRESIRETSVGTYSALEADKTARILNLIRSRLQSVDIGTNPVLLTSMDVRRYVRKMIERDFYKLSVLSTQEMMEDVEVRILGNVEWFDDGSSYA